MIKRYLASSVGKKQIVAVTGIMLILFLIMHLSANLMIYFGPEAFNAFPELLHSTGPLLLLAELGLAAVFVTHIGMTLALVKQNRKARGERGYVMYEEKRSLATKLMPYTGLILLTFIILHLRDYVFADHSGTLSVIQGEALGLYGVVVNSFMDPARAIFYVVAMFALGFHLAHGVQSVIQSFGVRQGPISPMVNGVSTAIGLAFAVLFSSIPVYVYFLYGCCS